MGAAPSKLMETSTILDGLYAGSLIVTPVYPSWDNHHFSSEP